MGLGVQRQKQDFLDWNFPLSAPVTKIFIGEAFLTWQLLGYLGKDVSLGGLNRHSSLTNSLDRLVLTDLKDQVSL